MWDRDFFTGGIFLGEVVVSGDELLHPKTNDNVEGHLKAKADEVDNKIKGTLTYRLVAKSIPQRLKFLPKDFVEIKSQKNFF